MEEETLNQSFHTHPRLPSPDPTLPLTTYNLHCILSDLVERIPRMNPRNTFNRSSFWDISSLAGITLHDNADTYRLLIAVNMKSRIEPQRPVSCDDG